MTRKQAQKAIRRHLSQALRAPEVVVLLNQPMDTSIKGAYLVGADGSVDLRQHGNVHVSGKTVPGAKKAIEAHLARRFLRPEVSLQVVAYNSKVYYIISQGAKLGDNVFRIPITGNETVLDAIRKIGGFSRLSRRKIWIARPAADGSDRGEILPVDWEAITRGTSMKTNYRLLPDDRVFIGQEIRQEKSREESPGGTDSPDRAKQTSPLLKRVRLRLRG